MNPKRLATGGGITAIAVSLLYLLGWWLLWRLLVTNPLPAMLYMPPLSAFGCMLAGAALWCAAKGNLPRATRGFAAAIMLLALAVLAAYMLKTERGVERLFFSEQAQALLGGPHPGRPAPQEALAFLLIGLALWFSVPGRKAYFDLADIASAGAIFVSFTALLGHLYQARELYGETSALSLVDALLLLGLGLGALSLNPHGILAAYGAANTGGAARRRLLPAVVLTPVVLGLFQFLAVSHGWLEFSLALALAVAASIVLFIALIEWVSRLLVKIEVERSGEMRLRETKAKEEGMTDKLTGLLNRRGWDHCVSTWEERCKRENLNACVIVIDLDGLKRINDTEGHAKGDELLRRAGTALRTAARREDYLARLGGDEFAYLAVGCGPEHAEIVVKRLAGSLAAVRVMASVGFALRDLAGSITAAFQEADQAMYANKRANKARVEKSFTPSLGESR